MSIGLQDHRKGVDYLIRACARWQSAEPASIVLAGKLSAQIRQLVTNEYRHLVGEGRLIVLDQYLSKEELLCLLRGGRPDRRSVSPSATSIRHRASGRHCGKDGAGGE